MNFLFRINSLKQIKDQKVVWFLIFISSLFVILRIPSLVEPNWYGDEGIYQVVGQVISRGGILYKDVWDNKPPLLYIIYSIFDGNLFFVKLASLIIGLLSVLSFYLLTGKVFRKIQSRYIASAIFAFLFALPLLEGNIANAENFILLPIILGAYLVLKYKESKKVLFLYFSGFLLSIAFLTKVVAVFDFLSFSLFLGIILWEEHGRKSFSIKYLKNHIFFTLVFSSFLILSSIYFLIFGAFDDFIRAVFSQNLNYVNFANNLFIPNGILFLKTFLLLGFLIFILKKRKIFDHTELFIYLWISFSIFNALFSHRPYIHYILVMLPAFSLLCGFIYESRKRLIINSLIIIGIMLISYFHFTVYKRTLEYYINYIEFMTNKKTIVNYENFFDIQTPRNYEIADFIKDNTKSYEQVFLWSDSPQIYALSNKLPIVKYVVAYHITFYSDANDETRRAIDMKKPKFIIQTSPVPITEGIVANYRLRYILSGANIYEREL